MWNLFLVHTEAKSRKVFKWAWIQVILGLILPIIFIIAPMQTVGLQQSSISLWLIMQIPFQKLLIQTVWSLPSCSLQVQVIPYQRLLPWNASLQGFKVQSDNVEHRRIFKTGKIHPGTEAFDSCWFVCFVKHSGLHFLLFRVQGRS